MKETDFGSRNVTEKGRARELSSAEPRRKKGSALVVARRSSQTTEDRGGRGRVDASRSGREGVSSASGKARKAEGPVGAATIRDRSAIFELYREWVALRTVLGWTTVGSATYDQLLDATWETEHAIASASPESFADVRMQALIVRHWLDDCSTEPIVEKFLDSLIQLRAE